MVDRRDFLKWSAITLATAPFAVGVNEAAAAGQASAQDSIDGQRAPVVTPNGMSTMGQMIDGVRVFHLVAEPTPHTVADGLELQMWGFNGRTPGPTLEAMEGERIRIYVTNRLPAPTAIHWHGIEVPNGMDGIGGLTQRAIYPGETYRYEFELPRPGTFMYHPHTDEMTQIGMGMMGGLVVHPDEPDEDVDRDFLITLSEFAVRAGRHRADTTEMVDFDILTMNSKVFPATEPLLVEQDDRVRIRLINMSQMSHHPIHLHGHAFEISATEGGPIPEGARWPETTVLVPTGAVREILFVADNPGDWPLHCHMLHHIMNQMGHPEPNPVGIDVDRLQEVVGPVVPGFEAMGQAGMAGMADHAPRFEDTAYPDVDEPTHSPADGGDMHGDHDQGHDEQDQAHDEQDQAHAMEMPDNSIAMHVTEGPFGAIEMGGMFTVLMVRRELPEDPANIDWYDHPEETVAREATQRELRRDGIEVSEDSDVEDEPGDQPHDHH